MKGLILVAVMMMAVFAIVAHAEPLFTQTDSAVAEAIAKLTKRAEALATYAPKVVEDMVSAKVMETKAWLFVGVAALGLAVLMTVVLSFAAQSNSNRSELFGPVSLVIGIPSFFFGIIAVPCAAVELWKWTHATAYMIFLALR